MLALQALDGDQYARADIRGSLRSQFTMIAYIYVVRFAHGEKKSVENAQLIAIWVKQRPEILELRLDLCSGQLASTKTLELRLDLCSSHLGSLRS